MTMLQMSFQALLAQALFGLVLFLLLAGFVRATSKQLNARARSLIFAGYFIAMTLPISSMVSSLLERSKSQFVLVSLNMPGSGGLVADTQQKLEGLSGFWWVSVIWLVGVTSGLVFFVILPVLGQRRFEKGWSRNLLHPQVLDFDNPPEGMNVYISDATSLPFVSGILRPKIILPRGLYVDGLSSVQRKSILLHEWAHIRHKDLLAMLFARVVSCIFWFLPTVYLSYFLMRRNQEIAADEVALEHLGPGSRIHFAQALVKLAEWDCPRVSPGLNMSLLNNKDLTRRLRMIKKFKKPMKTPRVLLMLLVAGASALAVAATKTNENKREYLMSFTVLENGEPVSQPRLVTLDGEDAEIIVGSDKWVRSLKVTATGASDDSLKVDLAYCLEKKLEGDIQMRPENNVQRNCIEQFEKSLVTQLGAEERFQGTAGVEYKMHVVEYQ